MLRIEELSVSYGRRRVLKSVSLSVESGQVLALIGPNGSGKSTLIRAASGVVPIEAGKVQVDGRSLAELSTMERARYLAVVPQARNMPPAFSVYESILLGRTPYLGWLGRAGEKDHERVRFALERTKMEPLADRLVGELSGGEQQRVLLARALAQDTPVLLLDEPTTHLDPPHQASLARLFRRRAAAGTTVVSVLHDLSLALVADRLVLLERGRVRGEGTTDDPRLHAALVDTFSGAVRIQQVGGRWIAVPHLEL